MRWSLSAGESRSWNCFHIARLQHFQSSFGNNYANPTLISWPHSKHICGHTHFNGIEFHVHIVCSCKQLIVSDFSLPCRSGRVSSYYVWYHSINNRLLTTVLLSSIPWLYWRLVVSVFSTNVYWKIVGWNFRAFKTIKTYVIGHVPLHFLCHYCQSFLLLCTKG